MMTSRGAELFGSLEAEKARIDAAWASKAGHHIPGTPYRYYHGWVPRNGADVSGLTVTDRGLVDVYAPGRGTRRLEVHDENGNKIGNVSSSVPGSWSSEFFPGGEKERNPGYTYNQHTTQEEALDAIGRQHQDYLTSPAPEAKPEPKNGSDAYDAFTDPVDLTSAQKKAVLAYTEDSLLVNSVLRTGMATREDDPESSHAPTKAETARVKKIAAGLDSAFLSAKPSARRVKVYRGVVSTSAFGAPGSMTGKTFTDKGFTSTTPDVDEALEFAGTGLLMRITLPKGTRALSIGEAGSQAAESEFLLPRGSSFRILSDKIVKGQRVISAEHIPAPNAEKSASADLAKVGAEGYIHGFICVRPPCGDRPGKVKGQDMVTRNDGEVVHKKSGWSIGRVDKDSSGKGFTATHADGRQTKHGSKIDAEVAITNRYNRGVVADEHDDAKITPKAPKTAAKPKAKPEKPKPAPEAKPVAAEKPAVSHSDSGERSGSQVWSTEEGTASLSSTEKDSVANVWYGRNFQATNGYLRRDPAGVGLADDPASIIDRYTAGVEDAAGRKKYISDIGVFKDAIGKAAPFTSDVKLIRGVNNPEKIFGPVGASTGKAFTDKGFVSATSNMSVAGSYSHGFGGKTALITIHARKGSRALKVDPDVWKRSHAKKTGQTPPEVLQEYTFAPGASYKILSDTLGSDGVRRMDMETT
jgi:hypothetical protein